MTVVAVLSSDIKCLSRQIRRDKGHYIRITETISQKDVTIIYAHSTLRCLIS